MEYFKIHGGNTLKGTISVCGSKNATTPILAATLLTQEPCVVRNVPRIEDVFTMLAILESMGARVEWLDDHSVRVEAKTVDPKAVRIDLVKKIRSSILLLGSMSARFDSFELDHPGGCVIGARPVGTHFDALSKLGVEITQNEKRYSIDASARKSTYVVLKEFSVTATENAMMLAAGMDGTTTIKISASEPHVEDLGRFLIKMGANIEGLGTHTLTITGTSTLKGAQHEVIPDHNEAATFLILGIATKSSITVRGACEEHLDLVLERLRDFGADFHISDNEIRVIPPKVIKAVPKIDVRIYPGIPSDIQAPLGVLGALGDGETMIHDTLYEGRFNYVSELEKMKVRATVLNPHQVVLKGPTKLIGTRIKSYDLRAGAALIIAALAADNTSIIEDIHQVDRGYERIEERLTQIGANIVREENQHKSE